MGSAAPLEGAAATALAVAAIRGEETARPDRLFADPLAAAFVAASGWSPSRPWGDRRAVVLRAWVVARTVFLDQERFGSVGTRGLRRALDRLVTTPGEQPSPLWLGLDPDPGGWRASVRRPQTLPHFPMLLHLGGFPDGS